MERFVLQENIRNFQHRLETAADTATQERLRVMLAAAQRELALLEATHNGVRHPWEMEGPEALAHARGEKLAWFRSEVEQTGSLAALIDPAPGLVLVDVTTAYARSTGLSRDQIVGKPLFEAFPDNPDDPQADGMRNLYASLRTVSDTGREHAMPLQRYDVADASGTYVERYWRPQNSPLFDEKGRLIFLLHVVEELTDDVRDERSG